MRKLALGTVAEAVNPEFIRALVVEFIATFFFVFAAVASAVAAEILAGSKLMQLVAVALAQALVVAAMASSAYISGGHLNPAVTFGLLVGGRITVLRTILYCIDQLLASSAACLLLTYLTGGLDIPIHSLPHGMGCVQGVMWEMLLTFSLLFVVYATAVDPKRGSIDGLGPMLTGFLVGANTIAGGAFSGASMNPARSFGPALVSWNWTDHWVYWVGPLTGGGLAGFFYDNFLNDTSHALLSRDDDSL